jgi:hypothetical protein
MLSARRHGAEIHIMIMIIITIIITIMPLALHTIALRDQTRSNSSLHLSSRLVSSRPRYCGKLQPSPRLPFLLPTPSPLGRAL